MRVAPRQQRRWQRITSTDHINSFPRRRAHPRDHASALTSSTVVKPLSHSSSG